MPRYKPVHRDPLLLAVVLAEQVQPGTFEFALDHLVDHGLDLAALDARYCNDETGASASDPRVMLKIVLLAYSRGLISSRRIEQACRQNVLFMATSGDSQHSYTHIAKFVRELGEQIQPLFTQVLLICDRQGLIGRQMFAIDGVKLPSNASKERSGTHAELRHRAERLHKAAREMIELHRSSDDGADEGAGDAQRQQRIEALQKEAQATRDFLAREQQRRNRKGQELKSNVTDNDSAKMATSKGVIQGYAAQDSARGRRISSQRIATVEPVFANLRHNKRLDRFTLRGKERWGPSGGFTAWSTTSRSSRVTDTATSATETGDERSQDLAPAIQAGRMTHSLVRQH